MGVFSAIPELAVQVAGDEMGFWTALLLGVVQGLTEYLPVSSSGHLAITNALMNVQNEENLTFVVLLHAATALSSIIFFWKDIWLIIKGLFKLEWNDSWKFVSKLALSAIPVVILGLFFKDEIDALFSQDSVQFLGMTLPTLTLVGACLIFTALLLWLTTIIKVNDKEITFGKAIVIGIAQAVAVLPGISRSGSTIAAALLMGIDKAKAARFSFLMVIVPILGQATLDTKDLLFPEAGAEGAHSIGLIPAVVGFIAAFGVGLLACKFMLELVKRGKLWYFSIYCMIVGIIAILAGLGVFGPSETVIP